MAKFKGQLVIIEETNLPALFYYKYLHESYNKELKYPPVQYYNEIDKKGIDDLHNKEVDQPCEAYGETVYMVYEVIEEVRKTVYHGFKFNVIQDGITDEGLANKLKAIEAKKIKEHKEPYNDVFKKYSVYVYNG